MSSPQSQADVDFAAAMHEADSNLEVRRLMLVLTNVLTPACVMAVSDCLSGPSPIEAVAWLPRAVLPLAGALLLVSGLLVTGVVARCHFGLVVNGTKLKKVETGALSLRPLNWLGVTTNFVALTALSALRRQRTTTHRCRHTGTCRRPYPWPGEPTSSMSGTITVALAWSSA